MCDANLHLKQIFTISFMVSNFFVGFLPIAIGFLFISLKYLFGPVPVVLLWT